MNEYNYIIKYKIIYSYFFNLYKWKKELRKSREEIKKEFLRI